MAVKRAAGRYDGDADEALRHFARALLATVMQVREEKAAAGLPVPSLGMHGSRGSGPTKRVRR